ncbi:hypothetical protein ACFCYM_09885 [Streptomyces sp. NPDC056254]|uniref:hypothetical protein n=1 Tax=Streptomyces sp. NPDC056254 TaxID=3345763 RepID=UPI0035DCE4CA
MPRELPLLLFALLCLAFHLVQYRASRRLERQQPRRLPPVQLPTSDRLSNPGNGRHRRGGAPDAWAACHTTRCAHLTTPHSRTPAGLECHECGHVISGGPMHDYAEHADEADYPTREEEKAAEIALDVAADEARWAAEGAAAGEPEGDECGAEFIDGSWTYCGCEDCVEREAREESDL